LAADPPNQNKPQQIGHTLAEISEKISILVREEVELAKTEITQKATKLGKGLAVAAIAGLFALLGLLYVLQTLAWLFGELWGGDAWLGFATVTVILFVLAGIAGFIGYRWIKKGAPPTPDMAIDEAKKIRETMS
jgi:uncharacterized membrane protein YqjE